MKKVLLSLCLCLALICLPCMAHAEQLSVTKPSRMLTTGLLGATIGTLIGVMVAVFASSNNATAIAVGAGVGLVLGMTLAALTPTEEVERQEGVNPEDTKGPAMICPPGAHPPQARAGVLR